MSSDVISLDKYIADLQKERDDFEWGGDYNQSDFLQRIIDSAVELRNKGEVYYPLF